MVSDDAAENPLMYAYGVEESMVIAAETALAVNFSPAYRRFLKAVGGGMVGSEPVLGLAPSEVMGVDLWSVVETTLRFRREGWPGTDQWYVVSVDGGGNPIGLDSKGAVFISDHHGGGVQQICEDFEAFLETLFLGL